MIQLWKYIAFDIYKKRILINILRTFTILYEHFMNMYENMENKTNISIMKSLIFNFDRLLNMYLFDVYLGDTVLDVITKEYWIFALIFIDYV